MIRHKPHSYTTNQRWPRTSGDDPFDTDYADYSIKLAPHERG